MNTAKLLPLLAVAVIVGGVFVYLRGQQATTDAAGAMQEVPSVASPGAVSSPSPVAAPAERAPTSTSTSAPMSPNLLEEMTQGTNGASERYAALESAWSADVFDAATSPALEEALVRTLDAERMQQVRQQPVRVSGMDCRAAFCRIEAVFPQGSGSNEWATRLLLEQGDRFMGSELVTMPGAMGEQIVVVYAKRSGN